MTSPTHSPRERLDTLLVSQGLAPSRENAVRTVLAGGVLVDGSIVDKPAKLVPRDARIEVCKRAPFVSRAGEKLAPALEAFSINPSGTICLDVGCSTGGFTDCLLQKAAAKVYAVDVGYGQLAWKLRQDPRVVLLERTNIRYLDPSLVPELIQLAVIDVSFISLNLVLPSVVRFLQDGARVVALVKPQFEVGKGNVGPGGIVRDDRQRAGVAKKVMDCAAGLGLLALGTRESTVKGRKGNREILVAFEYRSKMSARSDDPARVRGEDA
ncbi:MAG TPA: TlyA family RNA methyltransferase [Nitrospira sp.]|nr:TlyA family RNA methyltransferase [Nitrospira sp.]